MADPITLPGSIPGLIRDNDPVLVVGPGTIRVSLTSQHPGAGVGLPGIPGAISVLAGAPSVVVAWNTIRRGPAASADDHNHATIALRAGWALCRLDWLALDLRRRWGRESAMAWLAERPERLRLIVPDQSLDGLTWGRVHDLPHWTLAGASEHSRRPWSVTFGPDSVPALAEIDNNHRDAPLLALAAVVVHMATGDQNG